LFHPARAIEIVSVGGYILLVEIVVLAVCAGIAGSILLRFPYPSPLIKPFLKPMLRWPESQIRGWIDKERINKGFLVFFSRDPERVIPPGDGLVAPADGVVNDVFQRDGATYIVIGLSFWDVHVQRSPAAGRVLEIRRGGDTFMDWEWQNAAFLRDKPCPVQAIVTMATAGGDTLEVRLITSYAARRINVWVEKGQSLAKGQRLGNITFGSTVTLRIPEDWRVRTELHERVTAGESILATPSRAASAQAARA
jgi:phosphatidylserine decarboxylase